MHVAGFSLPNCVLRRGKCYTHDTQDGVFYISVPYFTYPSGKRHIDAVWEWEAYSEKLEKR